MLAVVSFLVALLLFGVFLLVAWFAFRRLCTLAARFRRGGDPRLRWRRRWCIDGGTRLCLVQCWLAIRPATRNGWRRHLRYTDGRHASRRRGGDGLSRLGGGGGRHGTLSRLLAIAALVWLAAWTGGVGNRCGRRDLL